MITQKRLKEVFRYSEESGFLSWRFRRGGVKAGRIAGCPNAAGYIQVTVDGKNYRAHRLIWLYVYGEFPEDQIDHINGIKDDNRIENLRAVTAQENHLNLRRRINNSSGFTGVYWNRKNIRWGAVIGIKGMPVHLGSFNPDFEGKMMALAARKNAEEEYGFHENHGKTLCVGGSV